MEHRPRKQFGQNFLQDSLVINNIVRAIRPDDQDNMLEIGPGLGALTKPLLAHLRQLTAIEIDKDLPNYLQQHVANSKGKLNLLIADALNVDYCQFGDNLRLVGNLPYNISTPLLLNVLNYINQIKDMHFMLQNEVALRLAAAPGSKSYGRLSVIMQYHCTIEYLFQVPASAFYPAPKVESAIVRLTPHPNTPFPVVPKKELETLVAKAFSMRRKTLLNNLKSICNAEELLTLNINPSLRPEQISVTEYAHIVNYLAKSGKMNQQ